MLTLNSRHLQVVRYRNLQLKYGGEGDLSGSFGDTRASDGEKWGVQSLDSELTAFVA